MRKRWKITIGACHCQVRLPLRPLPSAKKNHWDWAGGFARGTPFMRVICREKCSSNGQYLPTAQPTQIRSSLSSLSVGWDYWHLRFFDKTSENEHRNHRQNGCYVLHWSPNKCVWLWVSPFRRSKSPKSHLAKLGMVPQIRVLFITMTSWRRNVDLGGLFTIKEDYESTIHSYHV